MRLSLLPETAPLILEADGSVRVGGSRVLLETVVGAYAQGQTAEEIAHHFPALRLADVHSVIAYYLNHTPDVEAYLAEREAKGAEVKQAWAARAPQGLRAKLLARQAAAKPAP